MDADSVEVDDLRTGVYRGPPSSRLPAREGDDQDDGASDMSGSEPLRTSVDPDGRPFDFLVVTTNCVRDIGGNMGNADYSYSFVYKALEPVLSRFGRCRLVERPESSLAFQAKRSEAEGYRPVQLAIQPPQQGFFTPSVPTIMFPFWEFPDLPDRDFDYDTRQNWKRMLRHADLVLTACRFTAETIRETPGIGPVEVVPVPLAPSWFEVPAWDPDKVWSIDCRHTELGGREAGRPVAAAVAGPKPALWKRAAKRGLRGAKGFYRKHIIRWLSPEAVEKLFQAKNRLVRRVTKDGPPLLPRETLELSGLVYTSVFNLGDRRKNIEDLLSAFLIAFKDRPDVTLVLKLATNPNREHYEVKELRHRYKLLNIEHECRVVVVTDYLSDRQMTELMGATTFYLNTSRAEGSCLPLQEAMASGRPAVAPRHTAMLDYIDDAVAFVADTHPEPTYFPHDPEPRFETSWQRMVWADLRDRLHESAWTARHDRARYDEMARSARERMREQYGRDAAAAALSEALSRLDHRPDRGRHVWSA